MKYDKEFSETEYFDIISNNSSFDFLRDEPDLYSLADIVEDHSLNKIN